MGCSPSVSDVKDKAATEQQQQQQQQLWDTRCVLTEHEADLLLNSWSFVHDRMFDAGVHMFLLLFKQHSPLVKIFRSFSAEVEVQLQTDCELLSINSPALQHHASTVMSLLDEAIVNIHRFEFVRDRLSKTGSTHRLFHDFKAEYFTLMRDPFLAAVAKSLANRYTATLKQIYEKTIDWLLQQLIHGFNSF